MAHPKHEQVRQRYGRRCGYCGVAEDDAAGELTVDHFHPVSAGGDDGDDNLVYCCVRCNLYKGDFAPGPDDLAKGRRALHPFRDDLAAHFGHDDRTGRVEPLTETGRFHLTLLHLNRPALVAYRLRQRFARLLAARQELLAAENRHLRALLAVQEEYSALLRQMLSPPPAEAPGAGA